LVCRETDTGEVRWRSRLRMEPSWLAGLGGLVLVAGGDGIACFDAAKGTRAWGVAAPGERLYPRSPAHQAPVPRDVKPGGDLSHFRLVGPRLVFVQGGHTLLGMAAASGEVLWRRRPIDAGLGLPSPYGMIHHVAPCGDDDRLLVQTSGRR